VHLIDVAPPHTTKKGKLPPHPLSTICNAAAAASTPDNQFAKVFPPQPQFSAEMSRNVRKYLSFGMPKCVCNAAANASLSFVLFSRLMPPIHVISASAHGAGSLSISIPMKLLRKVQSTKFFGLERISATLGTNSSAKGPSFSSNCERLILISTTSDGILLKKNFLKIFVIVSFLQSKTKKQFFIRFIVFFFLSEQHQIRNREEISQAKTKNQKGKRNKTITSSRILLCFGFYIFYDFFCFCSFCCFVIFFFQHLLIHCKISSTGALHRSRS